MTRDVGGALNLGIEKADDHACIAGVAIATAAILALFWWWTR
jgi:hypothetical protein